MLGSLATVPGVQSVQQKKRVIILIIGLAELEGEGAGVCLEFIFFNGGRGLLYSMCVWALWGGRVTHTVKFCLECR